MRILPALCLGRVTNGASFGADEYGGGVYLCVCFCGVETQQTCQCHDDGDNGPELDEIKAAHSLTGGPPHRPLPTKRTHDFATHFRNCLGVVTV